MKYTLSSVLPQWNGKHPLPSTIHTVTTEPRMMAELELLMILCGIHGHVTALDILTGADTQTEKDADLDMILTVFQAYIGPHTMPLSGYTADGRRHGSKTRKMDGDGV